MMEELGITATCGGIPADLASLGAKITAWSGAHVWEVEFVS